MCVFCVLCVDVGSLSVRVFGVGLRVCMHYALCCVCVCLLHGRVWVCMGVFSHCVCRTCYLPISPSQLQK